MTANEGDFVERITRPPPGRGGRRDGVPGHLGLPAPYLVAPNLTGGVNTLRLAFWAEIRLVSDRGRPIKNERVQLFRADGIIVDAKTNDEGVVRFDNLPVALDGDEVNPADLIRPGVVLPDIMEEYAERPPGEWGKNNGLRDDYRKHDGVVHFVPVLHERYEIRVAHLTPEEKYQHFRHSYEDNHARYNNPRHLEDRIITQDSRWNWSNGSTCNMHVNFFLGYFFNYNESFTEAHQTAMTCLSLYSSRKHTFHRSDGTCPHRGYLEFLASVVGVGATQARAVDLTDSVAKDGTYENRNSDQAWHNVEYIRLSPYFDYDTADLTQAGKDFARTLEPFNVYSMADIKAESSQTSALEEMRRHLLKSKVAYGLTKEKVNELSETHISKATEGYLWRRIWDLDDTNDDERGLLHTLRDKVNWDHHCGVLMPRAPGGGPLTGEEDEPIELWKLSADGATASPQGKLITMKKWENSPLLTHLGIWKLMPLRPGGFSPVAAESNVGGISVDEPPRFIRWG